MCARVNARVHPTIVTLHVVTMVSVTMKQKPACVMMERVTTPQVTGEHCVKQSNVPVLVNHVVGMESVYRENVAVMKVGQ